MVPTLTRIRRLQPDQHRDPVRDTRQQVTIRRPPVIRRIHRLPPRDRVTARVTPLSSPIRRHVPQQGTKLTQRHTPRNHIPQAGVAVLPQVEVNRLTVLLNQLGEAPDSPGSIPA
jgi:hypothetical protein